MILTGGQSAIKGLDAETHLDSPTRKKIDLAGTWNVIFEKDAWIEKWFGNEVQKEIKVPCSIDFEGRMIFSRTFVIDEKLANASAIKFVALGINYECEVFVNDELIGRHVGGYMDFEFDIPDNALQVNQENRIKIIVDNQLSPSATLPVRKQVWGWKNYGGILRDVFILITPRICLDSVNVHTELNLQDQEADVHIDGVLSNKNFNASKGDSLQVNRKQASYFLSAELYERFSDLLVAKEVTGAVSIEPNKDLSFKFTLTVNGPKLWNPENPELYILRVSFISVEGKQTTVVDQYNLNMGFASVGIKDNALILNGNKIALKGVVWHEDSPKNGASLTYEQMEKDIVFVKSLGANAIRFAFHPPHPYMLNLCSRYGIIVIEEMPVWNVPSEILDEESFLSMAEAQMREMVKRDSHFPCVFAWGIGDQFDSASKRSDKFVQRIAGLIHQLDNRPVYYGSRMLVNDVCASSVDFVGITLPPSDLKEFRQLLTTWKKKYPKQPMIVLSYGKAVNQNNRNGYSDPLSQESQARFYLQCYAALKEAGVSGSFVAALTDWCGDRPILNYGFGGQYICPIGLLSQAREKRLAYEVVHSLYNDERINIIPAGNYRSSFPLANVLIGLFVIILIGYEYTNRRFADSLRRSLIRSYNFFVDLRDLHTVSIRHTLILSGAISITLADLLSNVMYHYRGDRFADYIITYLFVLDPVKEQFIRLTWHSWTGIAALTCLFFVFGVVLALSIRIFALFIRAHVSLVHAYSVSVWSAAPIIFLSPLAMSLFKILESPSYVVFFLAIIFLFLFWTYLRVLKGISVVYDLSRVKTYTAGITACVLLAGGLFYYYNSAYALSAYIKFIMHLAQNPW